MRVLFGGVGRLGLLLAVCLVVSGVVAASPRDYSYLFLQGKISDGKGGLPVSGTTIRLSSSAGSFETTTDARGVFLFGKLPVADYQLRITMPDGRVIRGVQRGQPFEPGGARFRLWLNEKGKDLSIRVDTLDDRVQLVAPQRTRWNRLWKEMAVFVLLGGVLAL